MKLDLVVLSADKQIEHTVRGLLGRHRSLGIRPIQAEFVTHPERDPGCFQRAQDFLRVYSGRAEHALVVFDHEGSGSELDRSAMRAAVDSRLSESGWGRQARAIVIAPELEAWVWTDSPHVDAVLGWSGHRPSLRSWLEAEGWLVPGQVKPARPKEAMDAAMVAVRRQKSAALFAELASKVSLERCTDPAFREIRATLQGWFP